MGKQGYISESMFAGRIVAHGKISDLSEDFALNGAPFSLYIHPKNAVDTIDTIVSVKCWMDDSFGDAPIVYNDWSPLAIIAVEAGSIDLNSYDVYWGCGASVE